MRGFQGFTSHTLSQREEQEQVNSSELSQSDILYKVFKHLTAAGTGFSEHKAQLNQTVPAKAVQCCYHGANSAVFNITDMLNKMTHFTTENITFLEHP